MSITGLSIAVQRALADVAPHLILWRRDFHRHPESGWTEFRTASLVARRLMDLGFAVTMGQEAVSRAHMMGVPPEVELAAHQKRAIAYGGDPALVQRMTGGFTGLWADMVCGTGEGPLLALRFDMDANDMTECTDASHRPTREGFASLWPGVMHACGHDAHTSMGLGVAEVLAGCKDELNGTVRLLFQPGEEGARGAAPMVQAGAVDDVDIILGMHIGCFANKTGVLVCGTRDFMATTKMDVTFTGISAHAAAAPEEGKNALLAACTAVLNLQSISRSGKGDTRITVGRLNGGQGRNVIPPNAMLMMETRGMTTALDAYMRTEAERIIHAAAHMWGCEVSLKKTGESAGGMSDEAVVSTMQTLATDVKGFSETVLLRPCGGTEDFACLMSRVQEKGGKGTFMQLGTNLVAGHHNDHFDIDETSLEQGVEMLVRATWHYLG